MALLTFSVCASRPGFFMATPKVMQGNRPANDTFHPPLKSHILIVS